MQRRSGLSIAERLTGAGLMIASALIGFVMLMGKARAEFIHAETEAYRHVSVNPAAVLADAPTWAAYLFFSLIGALAWCRIAGDLTRRGILSYIPAVIIGAVGGGELADYIGGSRPAMNALLLIGVATIFASICVCALCEWLAQGDNRGKFVNWIISRVKSGADTGKDIH